MCVDEYCCGIINVFLLKNILLFLHITRTYARSPYTGTILYIAVLSYFAPSPFSRQAVQHLLHT
jgi:hypothetical protein